MMVHFCLFAAVTVLGPCVRNVASHNGLGNEVMSGSFIFVAMSVLQDRQLRAFSSFLAYGVCVSYLLTVWSARVRKIPAICAYFTIGVAAIFVSSVFMVIRQWFDFLAIRATSCYDCLRHDFLLIRKLCSEPVLGHVPGAGLLYYTPSLGGVK